MSLKNTKTHLPFWRAKGYLKVSENGNVRTSMCNWHDVPELEKAQIVFSRNDDIVSVSSDFMLVD